MQTRRLVPIIGAGGVFAAVAWRTIHRWRDLPYPFWMAVNPFTDRLYGTQVVLERLDLRPGQQVLEIGPGLGRILLPAAMHVLPDGSVTGVEIDHGIAQALRTRAAEAGVLNLTVIEGDAASVELPAAHFDVAYLVAVLGEITNRPAAMRRIHDALKPGGRIVIIEGWPDPHHQSLDAVTQLVEPLGFTAVNVTRAWGRYTAQFRRQ
jgi:ubiquinone/menaquinone biosynthesis C-methylase UbiE